MVKIRFTNIKLLWYYIETRYTLLLGLFGIRHSISPIPDKTVYCYEFDEDRNREYPTNGYWIKECKYYRSTPKTRGVACTYTGYYGFDFCLYDQCKMCGIKEELEEDYVNNSGDK